MVEFLILVLGLVLGFFVGQAWFIVKLKNLIVEDAVKQGLVKVPEFHLVNQLFIERVDNVMYLYDRDKKDFICQGSSMDELAELAKKYKNIKYAAVMDEHTENVVAFVDGRVEPNLLNKKHES